jgi:hypothetical protein
MSAAPPIGQGEDLAEQIERFTNRFDEGSVVPKLVQESQGGLRFSSNNANDPGDLSFTATNVDPVPRIEFEPIAVTRLGGTLPWETNSTQLQCGTTVTDTNGDQNIRLVYHAVCTKTQFERLQRMRGNPQQVKLISPAYSGPVTFDQLKFDRVTDANGVIVDGQYQDEPVYEIQLQSKEQTQESGDN